MRINKVQHIDVMDGMKSLPDKSVNCVITSPPYWQLRDYGFPEQWGLEPTFQEYLEHLWGLMDEIWRVLEDDGTVWINLGDTYNSGGNTRGQKEGQGEGIISHEYLANTGFTKTSISENGKQKCLLLIPHRFAIGCIDRGWIMRNDIIWAKRNGLPESVTDRFSKKHEYIFLMAKNQKYYFDLDGIRDKPKETSIERAHRGVSDTHKWAGGATGQQPHGIDQKRDNSLDSNWLKAGKNPGTVSDFWDITLKGSKANHYAAYNNELIIKPIMAGCPEGGIILDPFAGTGTTLTTAIKLGRRAIGFDGKKEYVDIANQSIEDSLGLFNKQV